MGLTVINEAENILEITEENPVIELVEQEQITLSVTQPEQITLEVSSGFSVAPGSSDGVDGEDGREVELRNNGTQIQWRYVGDPSWTDIISLSEITGADGEDGNGYRGTWEPGTYAVGDLVNHILSGVEYMFVCTTAGTSATPAFGSADWKFIASVGVPIWRGNDVEDLPPGFPAGGLVVVGE